MGAPLCIWTESGCSEDDASERDDQQGPDMSDHLTLSEVVVLLLYSEREAPVNPAFRGNRT